MKIGETSLLDPRERRALGISTNIIFLGIVSFFTDISSELIMAVLPAFLFISLGTAPEIIGTIEGIAESMTSFLKLISGAVADKTGNRKALTILGYSLSNIIKPLMGFATSWPQVLFLRIGDRVGKGIRTPPRDAIISDSSDERNMGRAFGIHRTLDQAGAVVGPLLAFVLVSPLGYGNVFLLTFIPGAIAIAILIIFVKEPAKNENVTRVTLKGAKGIMDKKFSIYIGSAALYSAASVSYAFILLRGMEMGLRAEHSMLIYAAIQAFHVFSSYPAGIISDRFGRVKAAQIGYAVLVTAFLTISLAPNIQVFVTGALLFGVHQGIVETAQRAIIPSLVPSEYKGTAYGVYNMAIGLVVLPSNIIAGILFGFSGSATTFYYGTILALAASFAMVLTQRQMRPQKAVI